MVSAIMAVLGLVTLITVAIVVPDESREFMIQQAEHRGEILIDSLMSEFADSLRNQNDATVWHSGDSSLIEFDVDSNANRAPINCSLFIRNMFMGVGATNE